MPRNAYHPRPSAGLIATGLVAASLTAPFGPRMPKMLPFLIVRSMPSTAASPSNLFTMLRASMANSGSGASIYGFHIWR